MVLDDGDYDEGFPMKLVTKDLGAGVDWLATPGCPPSWPRWSSSSTAARGSRTATTPAR